MLAGNRLLVSLDGPDEVVLVQPGRAAQILLTAADGLVNPVDVKVQDGNVYVASAAYVAQAGGNVLTGRLRLPG